MKLFRFKQCIYTYKDKKDLEWLTVEWLDKDNWITIAHYDSRGKYHPGAADYRKFYCSRKKLLKHLEGLQLIGEGDHFGKITVRSSNKYYYKL